MRRTLLMILLAGAVASCGDAPQGPGDPLEPAAYLPMALGRAWTYEAWMDESRWTLTHRRKGGDRRDLDPFGRIDFEFTYGTFPGEEQPKAKSIYARPPGGARLFYFDAFHWAVQFDPPLALLPAEVRPGATWTWTGKTQFARGEFADSQARLTLEAFENVSVPAGTFRAARVTQVHATPAVRITRWFAVGVGLVKEEQVLTAPDGAQRRRGVRLAAYRAPDANGN